RARTDRGPLDPRRPPGDRLRCRPRLFLRRLLRRCRPRAAPTGLLVLDLGPPSVRRRVRLPRRGAVAAVTIRPATPGDIDAVLAFWRVATTVESSTDDPGGIAALLDFDAAALL